jgi:2-C-methyl-D-erythritol 4-phosphate cytidylyltransferase
MLISRTGTISRYPRVWTIVPAAGTGSRMRSAIPKQYLPLLGKTLIEQTLARLFSHAAITSVYLVLDQQDRYWPKLPLAQDARIVRVPGGSERCLSVMNALEQIAAQADHADWVLVHDVARPCLRLDDLDRLLQTLAQDPVGGLLGVPVADTLKRTDCDGRVLATIDRQDAWRAYTPQMFRFELLYRALRQALAEGALVTDEASAIERQGLQPRMVEGHSDNIKVTVPGDLELAALYLNRMTSHP